MRGLLNSGTTREALIVLISDCAGRGLHVGCIVAARGLSPVAVSRRHSQVATLGLLTAVASLVEQYRL